MQKNKVELLGYYGGDKTHSLAAWASTFEELDIEIPDNIEDRVDIIFKYVCAQKAKTPQELLKMLADNDHDTPFEFSTLHFQTTEDIATHIQCLKHRIGTSKNTESARYKELKEDKFYLPDDWQGIKNSSLITEFSGYDYEWIEPNNTDWISILKKYTEIGNSLYHKALIDLTPFLGRKRAKESARYFKTYNSQVSTHCMFNFRSFMHFQHLRNSEHAQKEIREYADLMLDCVKSGTNDSFKYSLEAFGY